MDITLEQYILNPQFRSNAVLNATAREAIKSDYMSRYDKLMVRERGSIAYEVFYDEKKNRIFAVFRVPSETVEKFYYDVVFEFLATENISNTENMFKYITKFYSNDPSFVFTYAHAFNNNGVMIEELRSKMSRKAIKEDAKVRNPYNMIGYVKTIYFAYLFMQNKGLHNRNRLLATSKPYSQSALLASVVHADEKVESRISAGEKLEKQKKIHKKQEERRKGNDNATKTTGTSIKTTSITPVKKAGGKFVGKVGTVKRK